MDETVKKYTTRKEFFKQYKKKSRLQETWNRFLRNKTAVLGLFIFTLLSYVPVVGGVVKFVFVLFVLGRTFISYRHKSIWEMKSMYVKDERVLIEKGIKKKRNGSKA